MNLAKNCKSSPKNCGHQEDVHVSWNSANEHSEAFGSFKIRLALFEGLTDAEAPKQQFSGLYFCFSQESTYRNVSLKVAFLLLFPCFWPEQRARWTLTPPNDLLQSLRPFLGTFAISVSRCLVNSQVIEEPGSVLSSSFLTNLPFVIERDVGPKQN